MSPKRKCKSHFPPETSKPAQAHALSYGALVRVFNRGNHARQACGMKDQITLTDVEYGNRKKTTKREEFLNKMEEIIPWKAWVEMIRPYYPKGEHGRPVRGIETMLRMYLMQTWFNLSDEGTEDAIYDSYAMRSFLGINFMTEQVPDATTLLKFRNRRMS